MQFAFRSGINYLKQRAAYWTDRPWNKPTQVTLSITYACLARCTMCDIWKSPPEDELTADQWIEFLATMREWLGPFWLVLSGGEPFQKPGIFDILAFCRENEIQTKVSSNGMLLRPAYLERVLQYGPDFLSLSVESADADVHDTLRGVRGLHDRCAEAFHYLRQRDSRIILGIASVIMKENFRGLVDLVDWGMERGVDRVLFQPLQPNFGSPERGVDWYKENPHWIQDVVALDNVIDDLLELKRQGAPIWNDTGQLEMFRAYFRDPYNYPRPTGCRVRYNFFNVDPWGNVNFCWTLNDPVGNILHQDPAQIWESQTASEARARMQSCREPCVLNCYRNRSLKEGVDLLLFLWKHQRPR